MNKVLKIISMITMAAIVVFIGYKLVTEKQQTDTTEQIQADKSGASAGAQGVLNKNSEKNEKDEVALPVKAIQIKRGNLPLRLNISASADVWEKTTVRSEVAGTVESIPVSIGNSVSTGQVITKINDSEIKLNVQMKEAEKLRVFSKYLVLEETSIKDNNKLSDTQKKELDIAKTNYLEAIKKLEAGKITQKEFESISDDYQSKLIFSGTLREEVRKAQEGVTTAVIALEQAQLDLKRTRVTSPFPGVVSDLKISKGEHISSGQELMRIVNLNSLYLKGFALESEIANLKVGTRVRIKFDSYPESFYYGDIQAINPEIDPTRKTLTVYVKVDNKDKHFFPGMHAEIDVEYKIFENVIKVPRKAVIYRQDRYLVFVVRDIKGNTGIANWEYVTIGNQNDDEVEILSGVQEGDLVLIEGHQTLAHQSKVRIVQD